MRRILIIAMITGTLAGCASSGVVYTPQPFPLPGGKGGTVAIPAPADPSAAPPVAANPPAPVATTPPMPGKTSPIPSAHGHADGYALSGTALSLRGAPYRNGGVDPVAGFDCSGFVKYVYAQHGVNMPREVREQFRIGKNVDRDQLEPGDLVFFSTVSPGASHVGIMIGGDQFVHAPSEKGVVRVESLTQPYWSTRYIGAKRVS
jgi:cell wall-associated NlpC family hydrolase